MRSIVLHWLFRCYCHGNENKRLVLGLDSLFCCSLVTLKVKQTFIVCYFISVGISATLIVCSYLQFQGNIFIHKIGNSKLRANFINSNIGNHTDLCIEITIPLKKKKVVFVSHTDFCCLIFPIEFIKSFK